MADQNQAQVIPNQAERITCWCVWRQWQIWEFHPISGRSCGSTSQQIHRSSVPSTSCLISIGGKLLCSLFSRSLPRPPEFFFPTCLVFFFFLPFIWRDTRDWIVFICFINKCCNLPYLRVACFLSIEKLIPLNLMVNWIIFFWFWTKKTLQQAKIEF